MKKDFLTISVDGTSLEQTGRCIVAKMLSEVNEILHVHVTLREVKVAVS